jgi:hypothetical protein
MIELGVVETVQQMDGARTRRRQTHPDLSCELRMCAGHERGELFVPRLDERQPIRGAAERAHDAVDAIARIPIDAADTPGVKALQ